MNWWERLKLRWVMRGTTPVRVALGGMPGFEQQAEETDAQKFQREHGYSEATNPMPWGDDISAHNKAVDAEYQAEVKRRQQAYLVGEYTPRFLLAGEGMRIERVNAIVKGTITATVDDIDWNLEMSLSTGRRVDVTKDPGVPMQPSLTAKEHFDGRLAGAMSREVKALEGGAQRDPIQTVRSFIGSREAIVAACGGSEETADQVEQSAREMFGVEDLDAPLVRSDA